MKWIVFCLILIVTYAIYTKNMGGASKNAKNYQIIMNKERGK